MRGEIYFDERERRMHRRILKLKIYGGIAAFFVLLIGIGYLIVYSPLFKIKNIDITQISTDGKQIDTNSVIQELKDFFTSQSKITKFLADNILIWNNEKIGEILKNYPQITELTIEKDYLEREIKVIIKEREKLGIWCPLSLEPCNADALDSAMCSKNEGCFWFDKNGVIFEEAPLVEGNLINKVDDFSGRSLNLGDLVLEERFYSNLFKIFDVLEKSDLGIKSLKFERIELQEILTESSPKIYFSLRVDPWFTLAAIDSMKKIGLEKIEYIDLRVENRAYYKLK